MAKADAVWEEMARKTAILGVEIGSRAFGINLPDSDWDQKFVSIEDLSANVRLSGKFESYENRIPKGVDPLHPEGLDIQFFALDRFLQLAMNGNPTILTMLYGPVVMSDERGEALRGLASKIISNRAGVAYFEFMRNELRRWEVSLADPNYEGGVDWKRAMHLLRLGMQGVELLETGAMRIPLGEQEREYLLKVRGGKVPAKEIQTEAQNLANRLKFLIGKESLPPEPDFKYVDCWMRSMYWNTWQFTTSRELLLKRVEKADDLPRVH